MSSGISSGVPRRSRRRPWSAHAPKYSGGFPSSRRAAAAGNRRRTAGELRRSDGLDRIAVKLFCKSAPHWDRDYSPRSNYLHITPLFGSRLFSTILIFSNAPLWGSPFCKTVPPFASFRLLTRSLSQCYGCPFPSAAGDMDLPETRSRWCARISQSRIWLPFSVLIVLLRLLIHTSSPSPIAPARPHPASSGTRRPGQGKLYNRRASLA
jgi:hypothetical protein